MPSREDHPSDGKPIAAMAASMAGASLSCMSLMMDSTLLHELVMVAAWREPARTALTAGTSHWSYTEIAAALQGFCSGC